MLLKPFLPFRIQIVQSRNIHMKLLHALIQDNDLRDYKNSQVFVFYDTLRDPEKIIYRFFSWAKIFLK